ncbi:MAG TPA: hypothetical protein ENN73_03645 [Firmicutes bacterium]|nr:hypothetical protein [Bacillota bacterium]
MKFKKESGKGGIGVLVAIVIIVLIILVYLGYSPYFRDTMKISRGLSDALGYGQNNPGTTEEQFKKLFFDYCDTTTLSIEIDPEKLKFEMLEDEWKGSYLYEKEELLIPLLKINLGPISKEIEATQPFAKK